MIEEFARIVRELCDEYTSKEPVYAEGTNKASAKQKFLKWHYAEQSGLLQQLRDMYEKGAASPGVGSSGNSYESEPPVNLEAMFVLLRIEREVFNWCQFIGTPVRDTVEANLRQLVGGVVNVAALDAHQLLRDARQWHRAASELTAWTTRAPTLGVRCPDPACKSLGTLKANLETHTAYCTRCGNTFDADTIRNTSAA